MQLSIQLTESDIQTAFRKTCEKGDLDKVNALIKELNKADLDKKIDGKTPLVIAVENGHNKVVKILRANGSEPNKPDSKGNTPFLISMNTLTITRKKGDKIVQTLKIRKPLLILQ